MVENVVSLLEKLTNTSGINLIVALLAAIGLILIFKGGK